MARLKQSAACSGIGRALDAHEAVHQRSCEAKTYLEHMRQHGADAALEEARAYGEQIRFLRFAIGEVLAKADVRLDLPVEARQVWPRNPVISEINFRNTAFIQIQSVEPGYDIIKVNGKGSQQVMGTLTGRCRYTGLPYTLDTVGGFDSDGLDAKIRFAAQGTAAVGMVCPGGGGYGAAPTAGSLPPGFSVPLKDGSDVPYDVAADPSTVMLSSVGVKQTGKASVHLQIQCQR